MLHKHAGWIGKLPVGRLAAPEQKGVVARVKRLVAAAALPSGAGQRYASMVELFDPATLVRLLPGLAEAERGADAAPPGLPGWPAGEADGRDQPVHAAMRWDFEHYLPHEVLRKVDRASMAVALEVRCPLLDRAVADLAGHVPPHLLMPRNRPKGLLRRLAAEFLPDDVVRRPKRGFAVPIGHWMRAELKDPLADHLASPALASLGVDTAVARGVFDEHQSGRADRTHRLFSLLQLAIFAETRDAAA